MIAAAAAIPVLMIGSWLIADAQQPTRYSPVRQSISVLAGRAGNDRWIVTTALIVVGGCYLVVAAGLPMLDARARAALVVAGAAAVGIAAFPEPRHGSTPQHLALTAIGAVAIAVWPALIARPAARLSRLDGRISIWAAVVFLALLAWALVAARTGRWLGLAERSSSSTVICWPVVVVWALRYRPRSPLGRGAAVHPRAVDCRGGAGRPNYRSSPG